MGMLADKFNGVKDVNPFGKGQYFVPGRYDLEVVSIQAKKSESPKTQGNMLVIVEFKVLAFEGVGYKSAEGPQVDTTGTYRPGSTVSEVVDTDNRQYGLRNLKEVCAPIVAAMNGVTLAEAMEGIDGDDVEALCGKEQPATGARISCEAFNVFTKAGSDFTAKKFGVPLKTSAAA